ncbi:2,3-bisphosphoglycerate-dependent phosphoglycerate mutase [Methylobacterium sp. W2]|uniref:2,3-bisphosphoglycerate-dependent phosphoglycerate mutase n=1 Tax=Methylobacterium sp. W2 TaxID=2598107 RepID=UPI001D0C7B4F|nr:2,3-bisphosphoglycerate-dependent phosphoglycerate mutase [Methylobacterium sp. W2]MCC0807883.1 2,3-bisphosphoglycerate-dependent phosphoglycerate mutase [Methylobacterium sp. W2]
MPFPDQTLVIVRHGQSLDNERDLFSGIRDPDLTEQGVGEALSCGRRMKEVGLSFDLAFTSELTRARRTLSLILSELGQPDLAVHRSAALNERDYGELAGLNKRESQERWGVAQVRAWRKSYDAVPPGGESLAMTADRLLPYYRDEIESRVRGGQRVLLVAHGNSLRALIMHLDGISADAVADVHLATAQTLAYRLDEQGRVVEKRSISA